MEHIYRELVLKIAKVDEEIIPVVRWLNSFHSVYTLFSCQGDIEPRREAQVLFMCSSDEDLREITSTLHEYAQSIAGKYAGTLPDLTIDFYAQSAKRYNLVIPIETFPHFIDYLNREKK